MWKHAGFLSILLLFPSFQMSWEVPCLLHYLAVLYSYIASCVVKHCHSVATKLPLHCRLILFSLKSWCRRCSSGGMKGLCMFHVSSRASWGRENKRRSSTGSSPRPCGIDSHCSSLNPRCKQRAARSHVYYRQSVRLWRDILLQRLSWGENVTWVCQEEFIVMVD